MGRFGAAVSEHPLLSHATGEVVGQVLDAVGEEPDLAVVFLTGPTIASADEVLAAIRSLLRPRLLVGCTAVSVMGNEREVEDVAAVSLWAGRLDDVVGVRLEAERTADGWAIGGFPNEVDGGTLVLVADPFSFPVDGLLHELAEQTPQLRVVGGLASASAAPGGNRLVLDDVTYSDGAVGFLLPEGAASTLVSQGCRPVGEPFTVTEVEHNLVAGLGGRPAVERLQDVVAEADDATKQLLQAGLHIGIVVNEHQVDFRRGDFLIRGVMGVDRTTGAVAVGDRVGLGQTVQFQVRDADTADEDLRELLDGRTAEGALVFTCNGRGTHLFGEPDHDASTIYEALRAPLAGMFCAGEIGPVGDRNHMHGFTASVVLFS
ncbi:MAG: FIST N-terminal domain-containing protein [Actinomycetota bacterium]